MPTAADVNAANCDFQSRSGDVEAASLQSARSGTVSEINEYHSTFGHKHNSADEENAAQGIAAMLPHAQGKSPRKDEVGCSDHKQEDLLDPTGEHLAIARGDVMSTAVKIGLGRKNFLLVADVKNLIRSIPQLKWTDEIAGAHAMKRTG